MKAQRVKPPRVRRKINWTVIDPLLGTMSDARLGAQFQVERRDIFLRRQRFGIPPHTPPIQAGVRKSFQIRLPDAEARRLRDLAKSKGISVEEMAAHLLCAMLAAKPA